MKYNFDDIVLLIFGLLIGYIDNVYDQNLKIPNLPIKYFENLVLWD